MTSQGIRAISPTLEGALAKSIGDKYDSKIGAQVIDTVRNSLVKVLVIKEEEIFPESELIGDLGAESIDGLCIGFEIEKKLKINLTQYCNSLINDEDKHQTVLGLTTLIYKEKYKK
jgi:acyl carrier protein